MAVTAYNRLTSINTCDSLTNWTATGGPSLALYTEVDDGIPVYGGGGGSCIGADVDIETAVFWFDVYAAYGVSQDFTNTHIWFAMLCITSSFLDTEANGGMRMCIQDSLGNEGYWYIDGRDTYVGGWKRYAVNPDTTPTANNGTNPTITDVYKIGFGFKSLAKSKLAENCFVDSVHKHLVGLIPSVLTVYEAGAGPLTARGWQDIYEADAALVDPTGAIEKKDGVFFLQGPIQIGRGASGGFNFNDASGAIIVWKDTFASLDYYGILVEGSLSDTDGNTNFILGSVSGAGNARFGSGGGLISSAGLHRWYFDASDAQVDNIEIYGAVLNSSAIMQLVRTVDKMISTTMDDCGQLQPNGAEVLNCNLLNSTDSLGAVEMLDVDDATITNCLFRNCNNNIYFPPGQTAVRNFVGLNFDDVTGKYDINNASGSAVIVNNDSLSNANSYNPEAQ